MARKQAMDMTGVEVSGRYLGAKHIFNAHGVGIYRVTISTSHYHDVTEIAEGRANILAARNGWKMLEGVQQHPVTQSAWDGSFQTTRDYTMRKVR